MVIMIINSLTLRNWKLESGIYSVPRTE